MPERVDPDGWLHHIHGQGFARRIGSDGCVEVDREPYDIKQALAGKPVVLFVNAPEKRFEVYFEATLIKQVPRKRVAGAGAPL